MVERAGLVPIGRFAALTGLTVPQLRHYDRLGILAPAERDRGSGYRYYSQSQTAPARVIALLRSIDMPLADVQALLAAPQPERIREAFAAHRQRIERRLAAARTALESIDHVRWEDRLMHTEMDTRCSFCRRPHGESPILLEAAGEAAVRICRACVDLAREVLELDRRSREAGEPPPAPLSRPLGCSFCGRDSTAVQRLVAGPEVYVCDGCLAAAAP